VSILDAPIEQHFLIVTKRLSDLASGEGGVVEDIASNAITAKLVEMGLYKGKPVRVLFRAPLGDPIAVDVDGYTLSLRKDEAVLISVVAD